MNKLKLIVVFLLSSLFIISCNNSKEKEKNKNEKIKEECFPIKRPFRSDLDLEHSIINKGDTLAYYDLYIRYHYYKYSFKDFLPYALIMANKYDYPPAYLGVFICLWQLYGEWDEEGDISLDKLDKTTRNMAIEYLKKGVEKGEKNCMRYLGTYYIKGKYVKKDVKYGEYLQEKGSMKQQ
ncbi:MAG TPA: hypothetical protein PLF32_03805 [Bacteroidales bacterium]|nr:hypothetical protein [Bacteroidales bacterium]HOR81759.1 hypothetical protein [Bacteroidales bacterium]HPJ91174.1 hypothetical protein [Bacteroidales bacterium]